MTSQLYDPSESRSSDMFRDCPLPRRGVAFANFLSRTHNVAAIIRRRAVARFGTDVSGRCAGGARSGGMIQTKQMAHFVKMGPLTIGFTAMGGIVVFDVAVIVVGGIRSEKALRSMQSNHRNGRVGVGRIVRYL